MTALGGQAAALTVAVSQAEAGAEAVASQAVGAMAALRVESAK